MGIISKIFGGGIGESAKPIEAIGNVLDKVFTSKDEKLSHEEVRMRIAQAPTMVQTEINKVEAGHRSIFVAGWRPFIGWVCGSALAYNFVIRDLLGWYLLNFHEAAKISFPPALQMDHLMVVLTGMLGLAGYRTVEKIRNKAK